MLTLPIYCVEEHVLPKKGVAAMERMGSKKTRKKGYLSFYIESNLFLRS